MPPLHSILCGLALLLMCAGCATQRYQAKSLDPERSAATYATRSTSEVGLKDYMLAHGQNVQDWPVRRWGLKELTLLAFYFHPDLALARAQVTAARAALDVASTRAFLGVTPRLERHSDKRTPGGSPWSLGFELDVPVYAGSRREAIIERERYALESAELNVGATAWRIRSRLRKALLDLHFSRRRLELSEKEATENDALVKLLQRRFQEGMASTGEVTMARLRETEVRGDSEAQKLAAERALGDLSASLGLPLEVTRALALSFAEFESFPPAPESRTARAQALLNRLDVRMNLLSYAGAQSALKLEVAKQYPELRFSPGYLWDQGDSVWSLALGFVLPGAMGNVPGIREAEAKREVAAKEFERLQVHVLSESESNAAVYRQALEGLATVELQTALVQKRLAETEKLFASGYADRVALVQGKLESLIAAKNAWAARRAALLALGDLEDATQQPLRGGPLPRFDNVVTPIKP